MSRLEFSRNLSSREIAAQLQIPDEYPRNRANALQWKDARIGVTSKGAKEEMPLEDVFYALAWRFDPYTAAYMLRLGINNSTATTKFRQLLKTQAAAPT